MHRAVGRRQGPHKGGADPVPARRGESKFQAEGDPRVPDGARVQGGRESHKDFVGRGVQGGGQEGGLRAEGPVLKRLRPQNAAKAS